MTTVGEQIQRANSAICKNTDSLADDRALLSQNVLAQLRNLVEGVVVRLHTGTSSAEFEYQAVAPALSFVRANARFSFLGRFHKLIQKIASYYTLDGDASERLMLKYYEYLLRTRRVLADDCETDVLANLESFPIDLDPSLKDYHEKIGDRIEAVRRSPPSSGRSYRYYIHKTRPFFTGGRIYYEVTFYRAVNKVSKFDRIIAFTDIDMTDKYSAMLALENDSIDVLGETMPITIIREWDVSIRPCEFDNFARLLGITTKVQTNSSEYRYLMESLTSRSSNLLDVIDLPDNDYGAVRADGMVRVGRPQIFPVLDEARRLVQAAAPGHNVIRYLMLRMHNQILKQQYSPEGCRHLSDMKAHYGCIPFDTMPFCTSLKGHNPRFWDLVESVDMTGRDDEVLARRVKNNVERHGILYTPVADLEEFGDVAKLIAAHNGKLYYKHTPVSSLWTRSTSSCGGTRTTPSRSLRSSRI